MIILIIKLRNVMKQFYLQKNVVHDYEKSKVSCEIMLKRKPKNLPNEIQS